MKGVAAFLLVLCYLAISASAWTCTNGPLLTNAQQIDAGLGKVVARDRNNHPYFLIGSSWHSLSNITFRHVSVGPAGLWGAGIDYSVYKYVAGNFQPSSGLSLWQVDAGGDDQIMGINTDMSISCLRSASALANSGGGSLEWTSVSGSLKYISCSPNNGCWGVNLNDQIFYTQNVDPTTCSYSGWIRVPGSLSMGEMATDGSFFGVNGIGQVFERIGISSRNPYGTTWNNIPMSMEIGHVSYDLGKLWVVTVSGLVMNCER